MSEIKQYETVIIGGGPAGLGPLVAADQLGELNKWVNHRRGICVIDGGEAANFGSGALGNYAINSNSPPRDFLENLRVDGELRGVLQSNIGRRIVERDERREAVLPLREVGDLQREIGSTLFEILDGSEVSDVRFNTRVKCVRLLDDGFVIFDREDQELARSKKLLLATGGRQELLDIYGGNSDKVVLSGAVIEEGDELVRALDVLAAGREIVILGGSHSAFSVVWKLLEFAERQEIAIGDGAVKVISRETPRLFYENSRAADADDYAFDREWDVCEETDRVNRFGGVRGDAKELYRRISSGNERRVVLSDKVGGAFNRAGLIVQATGYRANAVPLYKPNGELVGPYINDYGRVEVNNSCRIFTENGDVLPNAWAVGLAHGVNAGIFGGEKSFRGVLDAVNLYQGAVGTIVYNQLK